MRFANSTHTLGGFSGFVNGLAVFTILGIIAAGYFSAIGSFAGVA